MRLLTSSPANDWRRGGVLDEFFRQPPELCVRFLLLRVLVDANNSRQHSNDIAVEYRRGLVECDAADGAGGVATDAGESEDVIKGFRKFSGVAFLDELRRLLQVPDAGVVTKPFPELVDFFRTGRCQGLD